VLRVYGTCGEIFNIKQVNESVACPFLQSASMLKFKQAVLSLSIMNFTVRVFEFLLPWLHGCVYTFSGK
jgi:hypothetical protein